MFRSLKDTLVSAAVLRIVLIWWAEFQDENFDVSYTDIDYSVFTDAANHVVNGRSPFERDTYRYTPLLAWMLTPNIVFAKNFGKYLFSGCDIVVGYIIHQLALQSFRNEKTALVSASMWLFNPITVVVSTRGSADSLMTLLVLSTLILHHRRRWILSGICLGLAVHFKIYPIIYSLSLYLAIEKSVLPNFAKIRFGLTFLISLAFWTGLGYYFYGWKFLEEAYLYHVTRKDVKHNFSPYFYLLYLTEDGNAPWLPLVTFVPQLSVLLFVSFKYGGMEDLNFAVFCETFAFVTFNKVVTSQYFLWYLGLLPLCWPLIQLNRKKVLLLAGAWFLSQAAWLFSAYLLEFQGMNSFFAVWVCSLVFFVVNIAILIQIMRSRSVAVKKSA